MFHTVTPRALLSHRWVALLGAMLLFGSPARAAATRSVALSWDPSADEIAGYRVYYGSTPGSYTERVDVGPAHATTLTGLLAAQAYYFVVTVYDASNIESAPSAEASVPAAPPVEIGTGTSSPVHNQNGKVNLTAQLNGLDPYSMRVDFFADDQKIAEAAGTAPHATYSAAVAGTHRVRAVVKSAQGEVARSSDLVLQVVRFGVEKIEPMPEGGVRLTITGAPQHRNRVYFSDNLRDWTLLTTVEDADAKWWLEDPTASPTGQRFYKVEAEPL